MKESKSNWIMSRRFGFIGGAIVLVAVLFITYNVGYGSGTEETTTVPNEESAGHEDLQQEIEEKNELLEEKNKELEQAETVLSQVTEELTNKQEELNELKEVSSDKATLEEQIAAYESLLGQLKEEVAAAEEQLSSNSPEGNEDDTAANETAVELKAGHFIVGSDLPAKEYEVFPVGEGGSFIVRDPSGTEVVNTWLGENGVSSYVFEAQEGYTIVSETPAIYRPVE